MSEKVDKLVLALAKKGLSYEAQGIIWNNELHPRDHHGRFAKKLGGAFTILADLQKGTYSGISHSGSPGHNHGLADLTPDVKIGGVTIHPPEGLGYKESTHSIDWAIKPGEKVYKAEGGAPHASQSGVIVHHADGSATVLLPTAEGEMPKKGTTHTHFSELQKSLAAGGVEIDTAHPLDENFAQDAKKYNETVAELKHKVDIGAAPESATGGKHFQDILDDETGQHLGHIEKTPEGKFTSHNAKGEKIGNISKHLPTAIEKVKSGQLTTPSTYTHKKPLKAAEKANEPDAPKGTHLQDITDENGKHLGHIEKTPEGKFTSHDSKGEKIGKTAKHLPTAVQKVHDAAGHDPNAKKEEPKPEPEKVPEPTPPKPELKPEHVAEKPKEKFGKHYKVYPEDAQFTTEIGTAAKDNQTGKWAAFDTEGKIISTGHDMNGALHAVQDFHKDESAKHFVNDSTGATIGHVTKTEDGKWESYDAKGNKLGYTIANADKAIEKVFDSAPKPLGTGSNQELLDSISKIQEDVKPIPEPELAEWEKELMGIGEATKSFDIGGAGTVDLKPGEGFYVWPSFPTKSHFGAVVSEGKVTKVMRPDTGFVGGEHTHSGWQKSLDDGTLVKMAENVIGSEHVTPSIEKGVKDEIKAVEKETTDHTFTFPNGNKVTLKAGEKLYEGHHNYGFWHVKQNNLRDGYDAKGIKVDTDSPNTNLPAHAWTLIKEGPKPGSSSDGASAVIAKYSITSPDGFTTEFHVFQDGTSQYYNPDIGEYNKEKIDTSLTASNVAFAEGQKAWKKEYLTNPDGSPISPEPKAGATPKILKKKQTPDAKLPDSFTFDSGKKLEAGIGNSIWTGADDSSIIHMQNGEAKVYNANGEYQMFASGSKVSDAKAKKNGWLKIAVGEPKQELELPTAKSDRIYTGADDVVYHAQYSAVDNIIYSNAFSSNLESDETGQKIAASIASLQEGKTEFADDLTQGQKAAITKAVNGLTTALKVHVMAKKLSDPNYDATDQDKTTMNDLYAGSKEYPIRSALQELRSSVKTKEFNKSLGDIGFDLNTGSNEEFTNYAIAQGAQHIGGMEPGDIKNWAMSHLNAPNYNGPNKESIEQTAGKTLKYKLVAQHAEVVNAKKLATAPTKEEAQVQAALGKKAENEYKIAQKLSTSYAVPGSSDSIDYQSALGILQWASNKKTYTPSELKDFLAENPSYKAYGEKLENVAATRLKELIDGQGYSLSTIKDAPVHVLNDLNALGVQGMGPNARRNWLAAYLRGDAIGQYEIEKAGVLSSYQDGSFAQSQLAYHAGSPDSASGKVARQALADFLNTQDWWTSKKDPYNENLWPENQQTAIDALGLQDASDALSSPEHSGAGSLADWLQTHKDLPGPSNTASVTSAEIDLPNGDKLTITPGTFVLKSPSGTINVLTPNKTIVRYYASGNIKPGEKVLSAEQVADLHADFVNVGHADLTPKWDGSSLPKSAGLQKPSNVSQHAWDVTIGAEEVTPELTALLGDWATASDEDVASAISNASTSYLNNTEKFKLLAAPDNIKKLAAYASKNINSYDDEASLNRDILKSIGAKSAAGDYITPETTMWTHPSNNKEFPVPPGATVFKLKENPGYFIVKPEFGMGIQIDPSGVTNTIGVQTTSGVKESNLYGKVFDSPFNMSYKKAKVEGQSFTEPAFNSVIDAEKKGVWTAPSEEKAAAWNFKQALKFMPDAGAPYQHMIADVHNLPVGVKQLLVESAQQKNTDTLDAILWRANKGAFVLQPTVVEHPLVDPDSIYAPKIANGKISKNDVEEYWSWDQIKQFGVDYNLDINDHTGYSAASSLISDKLSEMKGVIQAKNAAEAATKDPNKYENLQFSKTGIEYGGMHGKTAWTDQYANEWMSKYYTHDPNSPYRIDAEHYGNVMGQMFGFNSANTFVDTIDGQHSLMQKMSPNIGDLQGHDPSDLNSEQLQNVMSEHVLDWLISNHDSHPENLLRASDNSTIIGIDKGQAFKHLHDDRLEPGYLPPENYVPVWYDKAYNAIANKSISEDQADAIANAVLQKAYGMQSRYDDRFANLANDALAKRSSDFYPSEFPDKAAFVQGLLDRKHSLVSDFEKLYKDLYAKAGYDWKIDTENFGKHVGDAHISNNPMYVEAVKSAGANGKGLFFNSKDVEDQHAMFNVMHQSDGGSTLQGSLKLTEGADQRVTAYAKSLVSGHTASNPKEAPKTPSGNLPMVAEFHAANVAYLQTVSSHAPNGGKNADGAYNLTSVNNAANYAEQAKNLLTSIDFAEKDTPDELAKFSAASFTNQINTLEQQEALKEALLTQLDQYDTIKSAHIADTKVSQFAPALGQLEQPTYHPSQNLTTHENSFVSQAHKISDNNYVFATSDGGHYFADDPQGNNKTHASLQDYKNALAENPTWVPPESGNAPRWISEDGTQKIVQTPDDNWFMTDSFDHSATVMTHQQVTDYIASAPPERFTFHSNQKEESVVVQAPKKQIKVSHRNAQSHAGEMDPATGKMMEVGTGYDAHHYQTGKEYTLEHGNIQIHYRPWTEPGVAKSQQGLLSIEATNWDGKHATIDDILDTLNLIGVDVTPADAKSLELGYWRQLTNIIKDRADNSGKQSKTIKAFNAAVASNPNMSADQELIALKQAWKEGHNIDPEQADWQPHFEDGYGAIAVGRPKWYRPDIDLQGLRKHYGNNFPMHTIESSGGTSDSMDRSYNILTSGRLLSTEERLRVLGKAIGGMSSDSDQNEGSSAFVFLRQNRVIGEDYNSVSLSSPRFVISPEQALYHSNYAYPEDHYGRIVDRKTQAYQDPETMFAHSGSGNEILIKNEAHIVAAIFATEQQRDELIQLMTKAGKTEVNGRQLKDVIFSEQQWNNEYEARMEKVWEELLAKAKKYTKGIK